jgi:hypothetical protein
MSLADEYNEAPNQFQAAIEAGLNAVSDQQVVTFRLYNKVVLSVDGTVFWVRTATTTQIMGSLHYSTEREQEEDQTVATNAVIFSAQSEVTEFNLNDPQSMWIGDYDIQSGLLPATLGDSLVGESLSLKVVFAGRSSFYEHAKTWYYSGFAVYPALESQIIDSEADLPDGPIVSNSLPMWLMQNSMAPVYPSFAVPANIRPPYIVAHIEPDLTEAIGLPIYSAPVNTGPNTYSLSDSQLMKDDVKLILYGFTNQMARQYLNSLIAYSLDDSLVEDGIQLNFGFMNSPAIRDEKRTQVEIVALAQKKVIHIIANYYSSAADVIARNYLLSASIEIEVS